MKNCDLNGITRRDGFLYLTERKYIRFRIPGVKRDIKYISDYELANGFYILITQSVSISREGLYKSMTNLLGFNRTGEAIVSRYNGIIDMMKARKFIAEEDGLLFVAKK